MKRKSIVGAAAAAGAIFLLSTPASATHTHVRVLKSGDCVVLAENGAEEDIDLSKAGVYGHNPNVDSVPTDGRNHPLHILVHKGAAGDVQRIEVMGSPTDPCAGATPTGDYVNP